MFKATPSLSRKQFLPVASRPGYYTCRYPRGADTVLSIQPDGTWATRDAGTAGAWEVFQVQGNRAVFSDTELVDFAIPVVD